MSYCVNCGVRLEASSKKCPLCGVQVINPIAPYDPDTATPYPVPPEVLPGEERFDRRIIASIITAALALPVLLSAVVDLVYGGTITWSLYVIGGALMAWVFVVIPLFPVKAENRQRGALHLLVPDSIALIMYLWVIERVASPDKWFMGLALPIAGTICLLITLNAVLVEKRWLRGLHALSGFLVSTAIVAIVIELATAGQLGDPTTATWSLFIAIPCLVVSLVLVLLGRNRRFRENAVRKLHF